MIKFIKSFFSWEKIGDKGAWAYYENTITGKRKASKAYMGYSPKDIEWLNGGEWVKKEIQTTGPYGGPR